MVKKIITCFLMIMSFGVYAVGSGSSSYMVVVDSGSSGNRAYVYSISYNKNNYPIIKEEYNVKNKFALASYGDNPSLAASEAIIPLLEEVKSNFFGDKVMAGTPGIKVSLLATAGMRTLTEEKQKQIYDNVREAIDADPFFKVVDAKTIYGKDEGLYGWFGANYSHKNFAPGKKTTGVIEVGGASAQVVFNAGSLNEIPESFKNDDAGVAKFKINGMDYHVFSISYLGLGQNLALKNMNKAGDASSCYAKGYVSGDTSINSDGYDFNKCAENYRKLLSKTEYSSLQKISSIKGFDSTNFYALAAIPRNAFGFLGFDVSNADAGITKTKWKKRLVSLCASTNSDIQQRFDKLALQTTLCAHSTFEYMLLWGDATDDNSLHIAESGRVKARFKIAEAAPTWTIGYVFSETTNQTMPQ